MINWNEFEHIHVIKKLKHVLQTWWNIDIVFTDERGQLKGFDNEKINSDVLEAVEELRYAAGRRELGLSTASDPDHFAQIID